MLPKLLQKLVFPNLKRDRYKASQTDSDPSGYTPTEKELRYVTLQKIIKTISSNLDFEEVAQEVVNVMVNDMDYPGGILFIINTEKDVLIPWTTSETPFINKILTWLPKPFREHHYPLSLEENKVIQSFNEQKLIDTDNLADFISPVVSRGLVSRIIKFVGIKRTFAIPVTFKNEALGVLMFNSLKEEVSDTEREMIYTFADMVSISLQNSILYSDSQEQLTELEEQHAELFAARQRERDMMDIMGHELRTPLSIIRMSLGLMKNKIKTARDIKESEEMLSKYLDRIDTAVDRESTLLERMLSSTKIDANRMELHLEKLSITTIIDDSILVVTPEAEQKEVILKFSRPQEELLVYADKIRLAEVIDNLVGNAVKYTPEGSVSIEVADKRTHLEVKIEDTGFGIPKEAIPHLGEKFYRVGQYTNGNNHKTISESAAEDLSIVRPGGTGLGLYVAFELIKRMGGKIKVQSEVGKGTTFIFTVPKYDGQQEVVTGDKANKDVFKRMGFTQNDN